MRIYTIDFQNISTKSKYTKDRKFAGNPKQDRLYKRLDLQSNHTCMDWVLLTLSLQYYVACAYKGQSLRWTLYSTVCHIQTVDNMTHLNADWHLKNVAVAQKYTVRLPIRCDFLNNTEPVVIFWTTPSVPYRSFISAIQCSSTCFSESTSFLLNVTCSAPLMA